jgi:hypothetical protein
MAANIIMKALAMKQNNERFQQAMDWELEWKRAEAGLGPSYEDEEQEAAALAATRPSIPSSVPIETPGKMGVPMSRFDIGRPMQQPMPSPAPSTMNGAMGLVYPSLRPPRRLSRIRRGY